MNIQTERIENHLARLTVEVEEKYLDGAKRKAAQKLAKRVNIPGFRKGKAPYNVLVRYVGEGAILEEAVEELGNSIYADALKEASIDPYGPGSIDDFKADPPTLVFTVPLQPEVNLNNYREVREEYNAPVFSERSLERALESLREQNAEVTGTVETVELGNRVVLDVHSFVLGEAEEAETEHEEGDDDHHGATKNDEKEEFIHEHAMQLVLDAEHEPVAGFSDALVGAAVGEPREFELTIPEDSVDYPEFAGQKVRFYITASKAESVVLPELNDELAAKLTETEETPLDLAGLTERVRENIERSESERYDNEYFRTVIDAVVEQSEIHFPEAMVRDEVDAMVQTFDRQLRQSGMALKDYLTIYRRSEDELRAEYRPAAEKSLRRTLVMRELMKQEELVVTQEDIDAEIERTVSQFDDDAKENIRKILREGNMLDNIVNEIARDRIEKRVIAIAKGENPEKTVPVATDDVDEADSGDTDENNEDEA